MSAWRDAARRRGARYGAASVVMFLAVTLVAAVPGSPAVAAPPGATALDASYGAGGIITARLTGQGDAVKAVAVQPNGAIVVAGVIGESYRPVAPGDLFVMRFGAGGAVDPTFGNGGAVVLGDAAGFDGANALAVQPDGKIVVGGQLGARPAVIRLSPSGAFDPSFGGGVVTLPGEGAVMSVALGPEGRIALAGTGTYLAELQADGTLDPGFGSGGLVGAGSSSPSSPSAVVVQSDGTVIVGGSTYPPFFSGSPGFWVIERHTPDGALDPSFGNGGAVLTDFDTEHVDRSNYLSGLALEPDGRIVAAGGASIPTLVAGPPAPGVDPASTALRHVANGDIAVARYLPDGSLDPSFAGSGKAITRVGAQPQAGLPAGSVVTAESDSGASAVAVDGQARIVVSGYSRHGRAAVVRYTPAGLLDTTFGRSGVFTVETGAPSATVSATVSATASALALQPDGKIVVGGSAGPNASVDYDLLLARVAPGTSAGAVRAWGWNAAGQVGDGSNADRRAPAVVPGLSGVVAVSAGAYHTLALRGDGTVWAWGWNGVGQLGDGTTADRWAPRQVVGLSGIVSIAAGGLHSVALRGDGTVWAWGWNVLGQLGDGTTATRVTPVQLLGLHDVVAIGAGTYHTVAVRDEGAAFAWGWNGAGQLGDNTTGDHWVPSLVAPASPFYATVGISAGGLHTVALDAFGDGFAWGWNGFGQLGPSPGPALKTAYTSGFGTVGIAAGTYHSLLLRQDGTLLAAGLNASGQLGDGTTANHGWASVPGLAGVSALAAGGYHSAALTTDRRILAWGWNGVGQLGTGGTDDSRTPTAVPLGNVVAVTAGLAHTVAIVG